MESKTKVVTSYVSHEDVQSAMERFLDHGGEITKIDDPCQEILLRSDMNEEDMNYIDPHAANPSRNGLGQVGNVLQQRCKQNSRKHELFEVGRLTTTGFFLAGALTLFISPEHSESAQRNGFFN